MKKGLILSLSFILLTMFVSCTGGKNVKDDSTSSSKKKNANRAQETGYATIFDNDIALARDRAIDDAKSKLVVKILGENISGSSLMENYELVSNIVEAKSYGLVKQVEIIKQKQEGNTYTVTIEGTVEASVVEDAVADALKRYGNPKFMVLVDENYEGKKNAPGMTVTELSIMEIMGNSGFDFVDAAMIQELMKKEKTRMQKAVNGTVSEDVQDLLLDDAGAEVIIYAKVTITDQTPAIRDISTKMKSKQANISLKAVDVYTGNIIATGSANAPAMHIDATTAAKNAIQACLGTTKFLGRNDDNGKFKPGTFMETIIKKFTQAANARPIRIVLAGLGSSELSKFKAEVSNRIRGVKTINETGKVGKAVILEVKFAGKTNEFEEELTAKASALGFEIDVKEKRPNKLVMTAKKISN